MVSELSIVFVWSQLDGGKVKQRTMARFPPKPYDAKAKIDGQRLHLIPQQS